MVNRPSGVKHSVRRAFSALTRGSSSSLDLPSSTSGSGPSACLSLPPSLCLSWRERASIRRTPDGISGHGFRDRSCAPVDSTICECLRDVRRIVSIDVARRKLRPTLHGHDAGLEATSVRERPIFGEHEEAAPAARCRQLQGKVENVTKRETAVRPVDAIQTQRLNHRARVGGDLTRNSWICRMFR